MEPHGVIAEIALEEDLASAQCDELLAGEPRQRTGVAGRKTAVVAAALLAAACAGAVVVSRSSTTRAHGEHLLREYTPDPVACDCDCGWAQGPGSLCFSDTVIAGDCCYNHCCGGGSGTASGLPGDDAMPRHGGGGGSGTASGLPGYDAMPRHGDIYHGAAPVAPVGVPHGDMYHGAAPVPMEQCKYSVGSRVMVQGTSGEYRHAVVTGVLPGCNYQVEAVDNELPRVMAAYPTTRSYLHHGERIQWVWIVLLVLAALLAGILGLVACRK